VTARRVGGGRGACAAALLALATLAGCASASVPGGPGGAPAATGAPGEPEPETHAQRSARIDPLEPVNRRVARFNDAVDAALVRPAAVLYDRYTPEVLRLIVGNVLSNLLDPYIAANNLLQGKPREAVSDLGRFALNSTFGFFGFGDPASDVGLEKHREDFGQTLGVWGVPSGPYIVLPVLGPSNARDTVGFGVDVWAALVNRIDSVPLRNTLGGLEFFETRARLLPADRLLEDALDRYLLLRDGYLQRRRNLIHDGDPPDTDTD
jgi:phospholipid-binding lipoprotein MlaA